MNDLTIRPCRASQWTDVVDFLVAMNTRIDHHIGYLGTDIPSILDDLSEFPEPLHEAFLVAHDERKQAIVGALGIETDAEIGRAWLHGPFVDRPPATWHRVADALYAAAKHVIPSDIGEHELCIGIENHRVEAFGKRHRFVSFSHSVSLSLHRHDVAAPDKEIDRVRSIDPARYAAFVALQERLFPKTYYTGQQILDRMGDNVQVFVVAEEDDVIGYIVVRVSPDVGTGYIEFVGVAEKARKRGIGSQLVSGALAWAFDHGGVHEVALTVSASNGAALALYAKHGFRRGKELLGLRTRSTTP
ncbi:GNAT family N-acetyltransferase [Candidatus Bipolaricaulota bacterium]|nr:GNAT family N-acetyltransferase [Candidatus Bipolaricaulota bacterium]